MVFEMKAPEKKDIQLLYFMTPDCNVCHAIAPRIKEMLEKYPSVQFRQVSVQSEPHTAGQHLVFTVPTILIFSGGKEQFRFSRFIRLEELEGAINKLLPELG